MFLLVKSRFKRATWLLTLFVRSHRSLALQHSPSLRSIHSLTLFTDSLTPSWDSWNSWMCVRLKRINIFVVITRNTPYVGQSIGNILLFQGSFCVTAPAEMFDWPFSSLPLPFRKTWHVDLPMQREGGNREGEGNKGILWFCIFKLKRMKFPYWFFFFSFLSRNEINWLIFIPFNGPFWKECIVIAT